MILGFLALLLGVVVSGRVGGIVLGLEREREGGGVVGD